MLGFLLKKGSRVLLCGSCMDARGSKEEELLEGATALIRVETVVTLTFPIAGIE